MEFTLFKLATGEVISSGVADAPSLLVDSSTGVLENVQYAPGWIAEGLHHPLPAQTSPNHVFNWVTKVWEDPRTLDDLRTTAKKAINTLWDRANLSGFTHLGKVFATDISSRSDIDGINGYVALTSAMPPNWVGVWKATDNSYLPITTVLEWIAFYSSMVAEGSANFTKAQVLKQQIADATTKEEIEAIVW